MHEGVLIQDLLILLATAFVGGFIMQKLRLPALLGYLLGGLALGTFAPDVFINDRDLTIIGEIGIAFLLFTVGVELSFDKLRKAGKVAIFGSLLQIVLIGLGSMFLLPWLFGISPQMSLFLGVAFSLSSTAVVAKILSDNGEVDTAHGEILIAWLLVQDLAVVPILIFLPIFLTTQSFDPAFFVSILSAFVKTLVIICATYILGKKALIPLAKKVLGDVSRELILIMIVVVAVLSTFAFTKLGLPGSVGAFLAGLILSGRGSSHMVFSEIRPFRDVFSAIFFVLLGTLVNISFVLENIMQVLVIGVVEMLLVLVTTVAILSTFRLHSKILFLTAVGLFSVGEFAFVVSGAFLGAGLITKEVYSLVLSISLLTLLLTPWQIQQAPALYSSMKKFLKRQPSLYNMIFGTLDTETNYQEITLSDHVVLCGHGRVGREISFVLEKAGIPFVVIDFNRHVLGNLRNHSVPTLYGDPADFDILDRGEVDKAKVLLIALPDRNSQELIIQNALRLNPYIYIICRSHFDEDRIPLLSKGANVIVQPEFEAGISMVKHALSVFGKSAEEIEVHVNKLKRGLSI